MSNDTIIVDGNNPPNIPVGPGMSGSGGGGMGPGVPQHGTLKGNPDFKIISTNNGVFDANGNREKSNIDAESGYLPLDEEVVTATRPHNSNGPYRLVIVDTPIDNVEERLNVIGERWKQGQPRFILKNKTAIDFNSFDDLYKFVNRSKQQGKTPPYTGPMQTRRVIATPGLWSEPVEIPGSTASVGNPYVYTINFNPSSNLESSFDVEIKYPEANGVKTINTMGPGSYTIKSTGAGNSYVRVKSHSVPVTVNIDFPK